MADPLLSVIVPTYNMAGFTKRTIESLLAQDYPSLEVIAVDDGSTDDTPAVLEAFGDSVRFLRQPNGGACKARNRGFSASRGEFVAFLDCDDLWEPHKARRVAEYFKAHTNAGMIHSYAYWIDAAGSIVGPRSFQPKPSGCIFDWLIQENRIANSTPVLRRSTVERAGPWDERIFTTADWDMWLRASRVAEVDFIPEVLARSRLTSHFTRRNIELTRREYLYVLDKYRSELTPRRYGRSLANMHFHLSRLYASNGDLVAAAGACREAARLASDRRGFRATLWTYRLGDPANRLLSWGWRCFTRLSCWWQIFRQGADVHPVEGRWGFRATGGVP